MTKLFNFDPYYDDFDEDKNYMRVLFRPGYSLQARELTQMQTILSNQIERFGNHIFKNGSPIIGGKISLDNRAYYIIVNQQYNGEDVVLETFLNKTIVSYNSNKVVRAKVIAIDSTITSTPILVIKYLSGDFFAENDELKIYGQNLFAQVRETDGVGRSFVATIQDGVYYFKGQFVKVTPQTLILETFYRLGNNTALINKQPSYRIGIEFEELIIDEVDDTSLLDPAQGSFNYQAPGATRYQLAPILSKRTLDSVDESSFFEVIRIVNGVKTKEIDYPIYSEIEKTLARRTFEESGNYTVDPFVISLQEEYEDTSNNNYVDDNYFSAILDPGKAYVGGYEVQTIAPTVIPVYRGRSTANVSDYDVPTSYGSYIYAKNMYGTIPIPSFPLMDVHCVPRENIDASTDTAYNSTKIGSLRPCMVKYDDYNIDSEYGPSHIFSVNVFDVNSNSITGTLASSGSTSTEIALPGSFCSTLSKNAYSNMYFSITNGAGLALAPILITSSGSSNVTLSSALPFTPQSNTFSIDSDFKVANSVASRSGSSITYGFNIDEKSKNVNGEVNIIDRNLQTLIFDVPFEAVKDDSISNLDIVARKLYSGKISSIAGIVQLECSGTDTFPFASSGTLSDRTILNNIICFITQGSATSAELGITTNTIVSLANSNFTVTGVTNQRIDIDFGLGGVRADFLVTTKVNNAEDGSTGATRLKQLYPLNDDFHEKVAYNLDAGNETLTVSNTGTVVTGTGSYIFPDIGAVFFDGDALEDSPVRKLRQPGVPVSLNVSDVYEIVKIIDSKTVSNVTTTMLTDPSYDITDRYELDNGQRRTHYDHASIKLKRGFSSPTGSSIYVLFKYFRHGAAPSPQNIGLFTVDSYIGDNTNTTYSQIPKFFDKESGKLFSSRSSFDFRPTRDINSTSLSGAVNPDPDSTSEVSFEHYLGRIDRIVVKPSREISLIEGKSEINPAPPQIQPSDMLIYTLYVPPYTENVKEVRADFQNNRRFTMKDIGAFENRIKGLEYYVALTALEKNANDTKILDANGLERSKYGILVDNFTSTDTQATYSDSGFDNRCLINGGELQPASLMRTFKLKWIESATTGSYKTIGVNTKKSLLLNYTNALFASQPYATKTIGVASALFGNFNGVLRLYPEFTSDQDIGRTARVTLNSNQGLENAFNFINEGFRFISDQNVTWVNDEDNPFAKVVDERWFETPQIVTNETVNLGGRNRGNLRTTTDQLYISQGAQLNQRQISTSTTEVDVGKFVTDIAINPYLKPREIIFAAHSLRPSTKFYSFFDNVLVDNYITNPTKVALDIDTSRFSPGEYVLVGTSESDVIQQFSYYLNDNGPYYLAALVASEKDSANVSIVNITGLTLEGKYIYGVDSRQREVIDYVIDHNCGITRTITSSTIQLAEDGPSVNIAADSNKNVITLVHTSTSMDGYGKQYNIINYNTSTKVATIQGETTTVERSTSYAYSLGRVTTDQYGAVGGTFNPPPATFRSGERNFRLTESFNNTYDKDAISFADKSFVSSGVTVDKTTLVDTVYNVDTGVKMIGQATSAILVNSTTTSEITSTWRVDPLAQTFFVEEETYPNGLFLESVSLFFSGKDDILPVRVQIRPTVNGTPSSDFWYPESVVEKYPSEINLSSSPSVDDDATKTTFTFSSPVFLKPGIYCVVVLTDSPDYVVWAAEKGQQTTTNQLVSVNPFVGTLYKSQNAMEYVPYLNEDLMFELNRCVFQTSQPATFILHNEKQSKKYFIDKLRVLKSDITPRSDSPISINYSFVSTTAAGSLETVYREISPNITYDMGADNFYIIGSRRKQLQNQGDFRLAITMSSTSDAVSPLVSLESLYLNAWENFIDDAEITTNDFNIIKPGSGYSNSNVITVSSTTGLGADVKLVVDGVYGNVVGINVQSSGTGYIDDFTISYPDTEDPSGNITANAVIVLNSEHDNSGGPCLARYITKPITLADGFDAGDIRIYLAANKPTGTEIHVFCKLLSSSDTTEFKDREYQPLVCINPRSTQDNDTFTFNEYEYRPSLTDDFITYTSLSGVTHDTFKTFSVKIVMTSTDPSVIPRIKDLRIIALPAG